MSSMETATCRSRQYSDIKQEVLDDCTALRAAVDAPRLQLLVHSTHDRRAEEGVDAQLRMRGSAEACSCPSGTRHDSACAASHGPRSLASISPRTKQQPLNWPPSPTTAATAHQHKSLLTLQIPEALRSPDATARRRASSHDDHIQLHHQGLQQPTPRSSATSTTTSLPSFASFQETSSSAPRTCNHDASDEGAETVSCYKLKPLVCEAAAAVAELRAIVQTVTSPEGCHEPRDLDFPRDNSARAVQWMLERLRDTKMDLQAARGHSSVYFPQQQQQQQPPPLSQQPQPNGRDESPANSLKRHASQWDEYSQPKRTCSTSSFDQPQRADSMDYLRNHSYPRSGYTPPPTASDSSSYQKITSSPSNRGPRPLPSPALLQPYSHSATPSLVTGTHATTSPPAPYTSTSNMQISNNHNSGNNPNSAVAERNEDLKQQLSLKSLALQTLQSEYASLLQKLQRERVKSQTIERKTTAADQDLSELRAKNEELAEQVRLLEARADEAERKRESERADYARDKEQWGRMLDMGGKLQSRLSEERQKLMDEKEDLVKRVAAAEQSRSYAGASHASEIPNSGDSAALTRDNHALRAKVDILQSALDGILSCSRGLDEKAREILQQNSNLENIVRRHLPDKSREAPTRTGAPYSSQFSGATPVNDYGRTTDNSRGSIPQQQTSMPDNNNARRFNASASSMMQFSGFSSGSSDMAYNYHGAKSSPEDLIKALGPVPAPAPTHNLAERSNYGASRTGDSRGSFNPLTRTHSSARLPDEHSPVRPTTQAYRSLPSPYTGPVAPLAHAKDYFMSYTSSPSSQGNYGSPVSSSGSAEDQGIMPPPPPPGSYSNWQISYSPDGSGPRA